MWSTESGEKKDHKVERTMVVNGCLPVRVYTRIFGHVCTGTVQFFTSLGWRTSTCPRGRRGAATRRNVDCDLLKLKSSNEKVIHAKVRFAL